MDQSDSDTDSLSSERDRKKPEIDKNRPPGSQKGKEVTYEQAPKRSSSMKPTSQPQQIRG